MKNINVLTKEEVGGRGWRGRMGVAYVKEANMYVLIIQYGAQVLFANSDSPLGPFKKDHVKHEGLDRYYKYW